MVSESGGKLLIRSRDNLTTPKLTLSRGVNLISYSISDTAASSQNEEMSAYLTQSNKTEINPLDNKVILQKDVDKVKTEIEAQKTWNSTHTHNVPVGIFGVFPSLPPLNPAPNVNDVSSNKIKVKS